MRSCLKSACEVLLLFLVSRNVAANVSESQQRLVRAKRITGDGSEHEQRGVSTYSRMLGKWPWTVRLEFSRFPRRSHRCGGALISRNVVLTAAHCVKGHKLNEITVFAGDVHTLLLDRGEYVAGVKEVIIHGYYHQRLTTLAHCGRKFETVGICVNDVALLVLDTPIDCQDAILLPWSQSTVSIFARRFPPPIDWSDWRNCHVAGWGFTSVFGPNSDMLRDADVSLINVQQCNSTCWYDGDLMPGMICAAGDGIRGQDACTGDSGGPLMCKKDGLWRLVGIVSWGFGCGDPSKPGVYADVGYYQNWILSQLIRRPRLEAQFWNSLLECKSSHIRVRECYDPWNWEILRLAGIRCRN